MDSEIGVPYEDTCMHVSVVIRRGENIGSLSCTSECVGWKDG